MFIYNAILHIYGVTRDMGHYCSDILPSEQFEFVGGVPGTINEPGAWIVACIVLEEEDEENGLIK